MSDCGEQCAPVVNDRGNCLSSGPCGFIIMSSTHCVRNTAGVGLLAFDGGAKLPLVALPLAPTAADLDSPRARLAAPPPGFRGCQYLLASESQLWHIAYRQSFLISAACAFAHETRTHRQACAGYISA